MLIWLFLLSLLGFLGTVGYVFKAEIGFRIGEIKERGPRDIAFEFLNAIEDADSVSALSVASPSCKEQVRMLFFYNRNVGKNRSVEILNDRTSRTKSEVTYRYGQQGGLHSLSLSRRKDFWEAECIKTELIEP